MKNNLAILIIGSGAVGNAIAREFSKYEVNVLVLEKEADTAFGTSGRNSGVVHAGFNNMPGSLMAKLCVQGSQGFEKEAAELGISFKRTGKLIVALGEEDRKGLVSLYEQGKKNGTERLSIIDEAQIRAIDPNIRGIAALSSEMTAIFDPFEYTIALAETAAANGAEFRFGRKVTSIQKKETKNKVMTPPFLVTAENAVTGRMETYYADIIINSAGLYSDEVCRMVGIDDYTIYPCRGEYHILDSKIGEKLKLPIYPVPNPRSGGLGVHLTPTISGNLMIGPSAEYLDERADFATTAPVMDQLYAEGKDLFPLLTREAFIRSFAGIRPKLASKEKAGYLDFVIEESKTVENFIMLVGIESPGLTSSIPIAKMVLEILRGKNDFKQKDHVLNRGKWKEKIKSTKAIDDLVLWNKQEEGHKRLICRCEYKSEADILNAFDDILRIGAIPTVKGLKNRTRIGMGNCQGSFCTVDLVTLLAEKRGIDPLALQLDSPGSYLFSGRIRI